MFMTELIHEFLFDCKVRELSDLTCSNYEKQLNKFRHFVRENFQVIQFEELKPIHVKEYISSLQDRGCKPAYINDLLKAVKCLCSYAQREGYSEAILLIQFTDGDVMVRNGKVLWDEDNECLELYDADVDSTIPFIFLDTEEDGVFAVRFLANDAEVFFDIVDQDTIINDIYDILSSATPNSAIEEEEAAEFAEADEAA